MLLKLNQAAVADIGAGTGYYTWQLAKQVGPGGRVYAVDGRPEMTGMLDSQMAERGVRKVVSVLDSETSCDGTAASHRPLVAPRRMSLAVGRTHHCATWTPGCRKCTDCEYSADQRSQQCDEWRINQ